MKAISIRQPYAWLVASGIKDIENRGHRFPSRYRGPVLIHASKKPATNAEIRWLMRFLDETATPDPEILLYGGFIGIADLTGAVTASDSPWFRGPLGLVMSNASIIEFIPWRGQVGLFNAPQQAINRLT